MSITPQELQKLFDERKPTEELVNFCFAEYLQDFNKNNASSFSRADSRSVEIQGSHMRRADA
jgi:hypothetical protein